MCLPQTHIPNDEWLPSHQLCFPNICRPDLSENACICCCWCCAFVIHLPNRTVVSLCLPCVWDRCLICCLWHVSVRLYQQNMDLICLLVQTVLKTFPLVSCHISDYNCDFSNHSCSSCSNSLFLFGILLSVHHNSFHSYLLISAHIANWHSNILYNALGV